jgi:GxxExxY protein
MMEGASHGPISPRAEEVATAVVDAAIKVHRALGPGLLESVYEACLCYEQVGLPVRYEEVFIETGFRLDVLVDECVIVELKSTEAIAPVHEAQLLTHLKLANVRLGFILNFNVPLMKQGIKRMVT